jgi:cytochrome c oxidase assembly protein subunit 15
LIWLGGLVTSYDAGMSVPDWPTTFGHWFYPIQSWLYGFWDMFLEHGHRMLAQVVGAITLVLAAAIWRLDGRKWMRWLAVAAVIGVCFQGMLGGLRVLVDATQPPQWTFLAKTVESLRPLIGGIVLANIHGCTAPLFFSLSVAIVTLTSSAWRSPDPPRGRPGQREAVPQPAATVARRLQRGAVLLTVALYIEIVLGAQLRHRPPAAAPGWFELWVWLKLILAGVILIGLSWLVAAVLRSARALRKGTVPVSPTIASRRCPENRDSPQLLTRRVKLLVALFAIQAILGAATWVTHYGWPRWFTNYIWALGYTVTAQGRLQVNATTLHAAVGSLTLVTALGLTLWSYRLLRAC